MMVTDRKDQPKTRYAVVGMGSRGIEMFLVPLEAEYKDTAEIAAICDINPKRLEVAKERIGKNVPAYTDFDQMLDEVPCDKVIVATNDAIHHKFIIKALEKGKDVITEKPMTIDEEKCNLILEAEEASKRTVTVTFNYRFSPYNTRVKELLSSGVIGKVHSVDFQWFLDTVHGADYYRRWHRLKENSGGLFVHKATHHFDLVNWWLDIEPEVVYASGRRNFYGPTRQERGERCQTCEYKESCQYHLNMSEDPALKRLYLEAESEDGYIRDQCVFDEEINIEDTMAAIVSYKNGVQMTYSLHSYMPFEGWRIAFNGDKGRLEAGIMEAFVPESTPNFTKRNELRKPVDPLRLAQGEDTVEDFETIRIYPMYGGVQVERVDMALEGHGGGDTRLLDMLFRPGTPDPLGHAAGSRAGAMSLLVGVAANRSIAKGSPVRIDELLGSSLPSA